MAKSSGPGPVPVPGLDAQKKGDGLQRPSRRLTGGGTRPARHIPWPELFKHHQSVLTGHLKMMDMVRKHCVEGTGNYVTAKACVDRTHQMMKMFKEVTNNFVPPKDNIDRVPLGASSASMYPGYSPADHIYGEAAQEFGERAAELKRNGVDLNLDPNGPEYMIGQKRKPRKLSYDVEVSQSGLAPNLSGEDSKRQDDDGEPMEGVEKSIHDQPLFVIDSKPTPRADLAETQQQGNMANHSGKRRVSLKENSEIMESATNSSDQRKPKKLKLDKAETSAANPGPLAEEEDMAAEVEARLKAKEEKRKRKEEKKRKRESGDSGEIGQGDTTATLAGGSAEASSEKRHKKLHREISDEVAIVGEPASIGTDETKTRKEKKQRKQTIATTNGTKEQQPAPFAGGEVEKPKKKRKRDEQRPN